MADATAISAVKVQLPDEAVGLGVDDAYIGSLLDAGKRQSEVILEAYRGIAAKTMMLTDVSESGSTRNMSILNSNARQMVTYWQAIVDKENSSNEVGPIGRFRSYRATRV